jgi:uroporphyrin-3 C-methyltransferase
MQINERAKQATASVKELKQQVSQFASKSDVVAFNEQLLTELESKRQKLAHSVQVLQTIEKTTQHLANSVEQQMVLLTQQQQQVQKLRPASTPKGEWQVAELRFLLQIADQRLQLSHDKNGALQALKAAETRLLVLGSSEYLPVRKKLGEEIVLLETFLVPNLSAISQRITDLLEVINAMPVVSDIIKQQRITLLPDVSDDKNTFLSGIIAGINDAVVIQKFDESVQKTMGIDEKEKLKNLLKLRFETLRLMVLQGLDVDYHQQLKLIKDTLEKYYPEVIKGSLQQQLNELDKVKLSPAPPDISASLHLLDQIITGK